MIPADNGQPSLAIRIKVSLSVIGLPVRRLNLRAFREANKYLAQSATEFGREGFISDEISATIGESGRVIFRDFSVPAPSRSAHFQRVRIHLAGDGFEALL
jgi:hypothetical protein